jgi:hypothetical protein
MQAHSHIAFKEWAVVVEALGRGEQILILRKGGIQEQRGQFHVDHREFWLFPTQYHETEHSIIPSKRPALREIAARASSDFVEIEFYAVTGHIAPITDASLLGRLQGRHIWSERVLQERFEYGREQALQAMLVRVYRADAPVRFPARENYGGCKSWVELEWPLSTAGLKPVLPDAEFDRQRDEICELLSDHALTHS